MISFVQPINDGSSGTFLGVICADAHLKWISEQLALKKPGARCSFSCGVPIYLSVSLSKILPMKSYTIILVVIMRSKELQPQTI